ncbi:MAG: hypothetical protein AAF658_18840, partial [Myxococcota bacterium]
EPAPVPATIDVRAIPSAGGEVRVSPAGPYFRGDDVLLTAIPARGYQFDGWLELEVASSSLSLTLTADVVVTATFSRIPVTLTVSTNPVGAASVEVTPPGPHFFGDTVTVRANPFPGWLFLGWQGTSARAPIVQMTLDGDANLVALYDAVPILVGPDTHVGNDDPYMVEWVYAKTTTLFIRGDQFVVDESYEGGPFVTFATAVLSDEGRLQISVDRKPGTHCYRVSAIEEGDASPLSNVHCVERLPGPRKIRYVNDLPDWRLSTGAVVNNLISFRVSGSINGLASASSERVPGVSPSQPHLPGEVVLPEGRSAVFNVDGFGSYYFIRPTFGRWDRQCNPFAPSQCQWNRQFAIVIGCDCSTDVYKQQITAIEDHDWDTVTLYASQFFPDYNYGGRSGNQCVRDPICL